MSFGGSPTAEESRTHMVYKRASQTGGTGRVRKLKKVPNAPQTAEKSSKFQEPRVASNNRNITTAPRMIKFEVEDAKFSEAYEQLKKSRKLRSKRSPRDDAKNATVEKSMQEPDTFMQPREFLRFLLTDAITSQPLTSFDKKKSGDEKKTVKREVSDPNAADSSASETYKKVKISHPLSSSPSRTKHVSLEELPAKLQKMIESALTDAVVKGKANDGDYLKIYYGDKVIKIPVSMSKYIKSKETTTTKTIIESYKAPHKYVKDESESSKNTFYQYKDTPTFKYETKYLPMSTTEKTEKAESYVNFVTPKGNPHVEEVHHYLPPNKSVYYFSSDEDTPSYSPMKNTLTSPGPVIFVQSSTPKAVTKFSDLSKNYENHIIHPTSSPSLSAYKTIIKEAPRSSIPITEEAELIDDGWYKPIKTIKHVDLHNNKPIPIPLPTSYIDFNGSTAAEEHQEKNYEFGYHISDYKTGNSYGHQQTKNKDEITGQYSILLPDGRIQTTKYFADDSGFHADVSYSTIHH